MAQGNYTLFDVAKLKLFTNVIKCPTDAFRAVLCDESQPLTALFAGVSTNCQYSDLTGELPTFRGYTVGGVALSGVSFGGDNPVAFSFTGPSWALTGSLTFKYCVIFDDTEVNKSLLGFVDMNTPGGGTVTPLAGSMTIQTNAAGMWTGT